MQIASLTSSISVISDIRSEEMHSDIADVGLNNEMPTLIDTGAEIPVETNLPDMDLPEIDIDIEIESMNEPEPETLQEIREELPTELEEINMEEDLKENENEQQEEAPAENDENAGENEEGELSDNTTAEEKSDEKEESSEKEVKEEPTKNEEKTVQTTKTAKSEKKQGSESENKGDKKSSATKTTQEIKSDIVVQEIDIKTIVSFNKEYFEVKITDTLDLTKTEIDFYDGQGFNDSAYAQNNIDFFALDCKSDCWGNIYLRTNAIQIDSFRR
jgi:FKBP-type peptidyl-prolyl cis-trans isomerase